MQGCGQTGLRALLIALISSVNSKARLSGKTEVEEQLEAQRDEVKGNSQPE
jgi:hypothetical protein